MVLEDILTFSTKMEGPPGQEALDYGEGIGQGLRRVGFNSHLYQKDSGQVA